MWTYPATWALQLLLEESGNVIPWQPSTRVAAERRADETEPAAAERRSVEVCQGG